MRERAGPLVLVVGPSGAGKDSVLRCAARQFADDHSIIFPRRVITREVVVSTEDHDTMSELAFRHAVDHGQFALWWQAHGQYYGLPASLHEDVRAGRTVVVNASRGIVAQAGQRFGNLAVIEISAAPEILAARLAARVRERADAVSPRLARIVPPYPNAIQLFRVANDGDLAEAVDAFCRILARLSAAAAVD